MGSFGPPVEDWPIFKGMSKDFPDVVPQQQNGHTANATNPEEKVGRQLPRIDLLLVHRQLFLSLSGYLICGARSRAVQSFGL
jgi:hypothetical protein